MSIAISKEISLSILDGDFFDFSSSINYLLSLGLKSIHFDIMDGKFVPNISFGHKLVASFCKRLGKGFDSSAHLMVKDAHTQTDNFLMTGVKRIVYHLEDVETIKLIDEVIKKHEEKKVGIGISIKPKTSVNQIPMSILSKLSEVLVMTVEPGKGGQEILTSCLEKVNELQQIRVEKKLNFTITIDGGVNLTSIPKASKYPIDQFVVGSFIWKNLSLAKKNIEGLQEVITKNKLSIS